MTGRIEGHLMAAKTRDEIRRETLEKQIGAIALKIADQQILAIPFVNSLPVQIAAGKKIAALYERAKPLRAELQELERKASAGLIAARAALAKKKGRLA